MNFLPNYVSVFFYRGLLWMRGGNSVVEVGIFAWFVCCKFVYCSICFGMCGDPFRSSSPCSWKGDYRHTLHIVPQNLWVTEFCSIVLPTRIDAYINLPTIWFNVLMWLASSTTYYFSLFLLYSTVTLSHKCEAILIQYLSYCHWVTSRRRMVEEVILSPWLIFLSVRFSESFRSSCISISLTSIEGYKRRITNLYACYGLFC